MLSAIVTKFTYYGRMMSRWAWARGTGAKTVTISGVRLHLDHPALSPRMKFNLRLGHYEAHEQVLLRTCLMPTDRVLEVGAGVGFLSNLAAQTVPSDQITAVEANPDLIDLIEKNKSLNDTSFRVINAVLGQGDGTRDFYVTENFWASGLAPIEGAKKISVPQIDFSALLGDVDPTVLVIDIEGGEADLLSDIALPNVTTAIVELHPAVLSPKAISGIFQNLAAHGLYPDLQRSAGAVFVFARDNQAS